MGERFTNKSKMLQTLLRPNTVLKTKPLCGCLTSPVITKSFMIKLFLPRTFDGGPQKVSGQGSHKKWLGSKKVHTFFKKGESTQEICQDCPFQP